MARAPISGSRQSISGAARKGFAIEGLKEIQDKLSKIVNEVTGREMKRVYLDAGKELRDQIRRNAPYDPKRKKGVHLRDAIFANAGPENIPNVLVGVRIGRKYRGGAPHAWLIEYGSSRSRAQPYLRPALSQKGPQIGRTIKDGLLDIIAKNTR